MKPKHDQIDELLAMAEEQSDEELELDLEFEEATKYVRGIAATAKSDDLLFFYARFKQAKEGPCDTPKPSFYQLNEKAKWSSWSDLGDMEKEIAMKQYVQRLYELDPVWRVTEIKEPTEGWVSVSSHAKEEEELDEDSATIWDHVKRGELEKIRIIPKPVVGLRDENGLTLLHWAVDRGHVNIVDYLLDLDAEDGVGGGLMDAQDRDGQTALHYATGCGHKDLVKLLLDRGADRDIVDSDCNTACNNDVDQDIRDLFLS